MAVINIPITNGKGSMGIVDGGYNVTADVDGYDNSTILPSTVNVVSGTNSYAFTIAATGTLTLLVTDDGTDIGVPIEGATFVRTDSEGNEYGSVITTNEDGEAVFNNVPFSTNDAPLIYYKQTDSDGSHIFDDTVQSTTMTTSEKTVNIENSEATSREILLTDANYPGLAVADGEVILNTI